MLNSDIEVACRMMTADDEREAEALEWPEPAVGDVRLDPAQDPQTPHEREHRQLIRGRRRVP
jgi:hypothetical protein